MNSVCFFEGKIKNTNNVFVKSGDYVLEKSAFEAQEMIRKKIQIYRTIVHDIEGGLGIDEADRTYSLGQKLTMLEAKNKDCAEATSGKK